MRKLFQGPVNVEGARTEGAKESIISMIVVGSRIHSFRWHRWVVREYGALRHSYSVLLSRAILFLQT